MTNARPTASAVCSADDVRHVPHCYLPAPWVGDQLVPDDVAVRHLERVLRLVPGNAVSYTDGTGRVGIGTWAPPFIERGDEELTAHGPPMVAIAVAPPKGAERQRFVVEKLAELGVRRLTWLDARYSDAKPPKPDKAAAWAIGALEQSRGAWLLDVDGPLSLAELSGAVALAHPDGEPLGSGSQIDTIAIGPAGGWHPDEVAGVGKAVTLGERILRTETAAIVAATLAIHA
ncbi:MAG: RsmE family RNA methyltransferase [Actinomycetota bacterium]